MRNNQAITQATAVIISVPRPAPPPPPPDEYVELKITMQQASVLKSLLGKYCTSGLPFHLSLTGVFDALSKAGIKVAPELANRRPVAAPYNGGGWCWGADGQ